MSEPDPFDLFSQWMTDAEASEPNDPNAMALSTVDEKGRPSSRMVLLKGVDDKGFVFYTNLESRKGTEIAANPYAALLFHWKSLKRQIRIEGILSPVSSQDADAYFASRPRASQIGAWASQQSRPMEGRFALEKRIADYTLKFGFGPVPRPPHWSGFRLNPDGFEFWQDRPFRLHDRHCYRWQDDGWLVTTLFP